MKLSTAMFAASIITMMLSTWILFFVSSEQQFWSEAVFTGYFTSVFCIVFCTGLEANGH
jgi:hypothetical protein